MRRHRLETWRKALTTSGTALLVAVFSYTVSGVLLAPQHPAFALSAVKSFSITSQVYASTCTKTAGAKLYPGLARCLAVSVHDPLSVTMEVKSLSMSVTSFTAAATTPGLPACTTSWLTVPGRLTSTFAVPAGTTRTVDVPIELTTSGTNQDNCENGTFDLSFSGTATYTDSTAASLSVAGSGATRTLKATISPLNPSSDPYGPATAPVHVVTFYACGTASCTHRTALGTVTLTTTTPTTYVAAATHAAHLHTGKNTFEVVYAPTGTATGTFTTSGAIITVTYTPPASPPPAPLPGARFTLTKSDAPGNGQPVVPGSTIGYRLAVKNTGSSAGTATVTDQLPANVSLAGAPTCQPVAPGDACSVKVTGSTVVATVTLSSGDSADVTFDAVVAPTDSTTVTNTATLTTGTCTGSCSSTVTNPVVVLNVVDDSVPAPGTAVARTTKVTYTLALTDSGTAATTPVTLTDAVPPGMTYVSGSANCGGAPGCSVAETAGIVTWKNIVVPPGAADAVTVSFEAVVNPADSTGEKIVDHATFTNDGTPGCTGATCGTNTVTLVVTGKSSASSSSTPPSVSSVPAATTPHTGEPFAGSGTFDLALLVPGIGLLAAGEVLRRRSRRIAGE